MSESQLLEKAIKESLADNAPTPDEWDSPITPTQVVRPPSPPKRRGRFSLNKNN